MRATLADSGAPASWLASERTAGLVTLAAGNPFFLEELARALVEHGEIATSPALPATVQAVLAARLDRLPAAEKALIQTAAVLGSEAPVPLLAAVMETSPETIQQWLAPIQAAEFLYETLSPSAHTYRFKHVLPQEAAYASLPGSVRRQCHQRIAETLVARFPALAEAQPELLAHHYSEADSAAEAVLYWRLAAQRAMERSAYMEASQHLSKGLARLATCAEMPNDLEHAIMLHLMLGRTLIVLKGYAASEVEQTYARTLELCQEHGASPHFFLALHGLWLFYYVRAQHEQARALAERYFHLAQREHDPANLLQAHGSLGQSLLHLGELSAARQHFERGIALYDPRRHSPARSQRFTMQDPGVTYRAFEAQTLWLLGYPDQALAQSHAALTLAQELDHPFSLAFAWWMQGLIQQCRGALQATRTCADTALQTAQEQGFPFWTALALLLRGWAAAMQGQGAASFNEMQHALRAFRATGAEAQVPAFLALLALACKHCGRLDEGLEAVTEGLQVVNNTAERLYVAELYRLRDDLLLLVHAKHQDEAVRCWQQALDMARAQQARSLELRAALSLAGFWQQQEQPHRARLLLSKVYGCFREGFDTLDLQAARALLTTLA